MSSASALSCCQRGMMLALSETMRYDTDYLDWGIDHVTGRASPGVGEILFCPARTNCIERAASQASPHWTR
jgi:hypothetical protein